ncbi:hypothetical protein [Georgenia thermotolerans]|uniref:hypothetical protein n=1 Tax=Georgenia thermotolerans TaxID=527326 RepID=UPI001263EF38|nr:hypothetical protein [Georgenia thermotolerans]
MAQTADGIYYPTQTDAFNPAGDMEAIARSVPGIIVPVANVTERNAYAAARAAEGRPASASDPIYVDRADTGTTERNSGSGWRTVGAEAVSGHDAGYPQGGPFTISALVGLLTVPAVPFNRILTVSASLTALSVTNIWDAALSVNQNTVAGAQRKARFAGANSAAHLSMAFALPGGTAATVRTWVERVSATGSIQLSSATAYHTIDVTAHRA